MNMTLLAVFRGVAVEMAPSRWQTEKTRAVFRGVAVEMRTVEMAE